MEHGAYNIPALLRRRRSNARSSPQALQSCIYPQRTLHSVEAPDCHFRRFTADGKFLIAFNRTLNGLQLFRVLQPSASAEQLLAHKTAFWHFFALEWAQTYAGFGETLHRDVCLVTADMRHILVVRLKRADPTAFDSAGSLAGTRARPNMLASARAFEDITLLVVDLRSGRLVDSREYPSDIIYLSGHHGISLLDDRLSLLSLKHQCLRLLHIGRDGRLSDMLDIGWYTREDDAICEDALAVREQRALAEQQALCAKRKAATAGASCIDESRMHVAAKRRRILGVEETSPVAERIPRSPQTSSMRLTTREGAPLPFILPRSAQAQILQSAGRTQDHLPSVPEASSPPAVAVALERGAMSLQMFQRLAPHYRMLYARVMQHQLAQQQQQQQQQLQTPLGHTRLDLLADSDAALAEPSLTLAPHSGLKQRLLGALFMRARASKNAMALQHFFRTYRQYEGLVLWRAQFVTSTRMLLRFVPLHVATARTHSTRGSLSSSSSLAAASAGSTLANAFTLLAEYNVESTCFERIWDTADTQDGREAERRLDEYRAPMVRASARGGALPSAANDLVLRDAFAASQAAVRLARSGGPVQAARKAAMALPFAPQCVQESALLDPSVFRCNLRVRQTLEKMRPAAVAPIRFYDRRSGAVKFVLAPVPEIGSASAVATSGGVVEMRAARDAGGNATAALEISSAAPAVVQPAHGKAGVTYLMHPFLPLVLSVRSSDMGATSMPLCNIHFWGV